MADDEKTPVEKAPAAAKNSAPVFLFSEAHAVFELSGFNLPDLRPEGTAYTPEQADVVRTLCRKYRVRCIESA
jgi:hypothetical protein